MNVYIERVLADTRARCANEPEFLQTVEEVLASLDPVVSRHPEYERAALLTRRRGQSLQTLSSPTVSHCAGRCLRVRSRPCWSSFGS